MSDTRLFRQSEQAAELNYVIIANGPFLVREIILEVIQNRKIVALDGAADKLANLKINPSIILGDFDSIKPDNIWGIVKTFRDIDEESPPYPGTNGTTIVPAKDQNLTDLVKAIRYCDAHGAKSIHILCATGGRRLDHHESATRCLRSEYKPNRNIFLHSEQQTLRFARDETVTFSGKIKDKCGIVAFPAGRFSSSGLTYGDNCLLEFGISESVCNSLKSETATVTIEGEALLLMPPFFDSQRTFSQKNEIERLEDQLRDAKLKSHTVELKK
jgi:thiamine pyrophosphokinase